MFRYARLLAALSPQPSEAVQFTGWNRYFKLPLHGAERLLHLCLEI